MNISKTFKAFTRNHFFLPAVLLMLLMSCDKEKEHPVPYVRVEFHINVLHHNLSNPGMSAQFIGHGYRGLFVYRLSTDEFRAYDRACPDDPHACTLNISEENALLVEAPCCDSSYLLTDGSPIEGPMGYPLREYRTYFDPGSGRLSVSN